MTSVLLFHNKYIIIAIIYTTLSLKLCLRQTSPLRTKLFLLNNGPHRVKSNFYRPFFVLQLGLPTRFPGDACCVAVFLRCSPHAAVNPGSWIYGGARFLPLSSISLPLIVSVITSISLLHPLPILGGWCSFKNFYFLCRQDSAIALIIGARRFIYFLQLRFSCSPLFKTLVSETVVYNEFSSIQGLYINEADRLAGSLGDSSRFGLEYYF